MSEITAISCNATSSCFPRLPPPVHLSPRQFWILGDDRRISFTHVRCGTSRAPLPQGGGSASRRSWLGASDRGVRVRVRSSHCGFSPRLVAPRLYPLARSVGRRSILTGRGTSEVASPQLTHAQLACAASVTYKSRPCQVTFGMGILIITMRKIAP